MDLVGGDWGPVPSGKGGWVVRLGREDGRGHGGKETGGEGVRDVIVGAHEVGSGSGVKGGNAGCTAAVSPSSRCLEFVFGGVVEVVTGVCLGAAGGSMPSFLSDAGSGPNSMGSSCASSPVQGTMRLHSSLSSLSLSRGLSSRTS